MKDEKNKIMGKKSENIVRGDASFFSSIRQLIISARRTVARGVDIVQVQTNFEIGRRTVEYEQQGEKRAGYGREIVRVLSERLTVEFGGGFSKSNLEYMRRFYLDYRDRHLYITQTLSAQTLTSGKSGTKSDQWTLSKTKAGKLRGAQKTQTVSGQSGGAVEIEPPHDPAPFRLCWSYYVFLMGVKNKEERRFYEIEAIG